MPFFMGDDAMFAFSILFKINVVNKIPQNMWQVLPAYTAFLPSNIYSLGVTIRSRARFP
jgi:hypothetical protein